MVMDKFSLLQQNLYKSFFLCYMDAKSDKSRNIVELSPSSGNIIKYHFLITVSKQGDIWQC